MHSFPYLPKAILLGSWLSVKEDPDSNFCKPKLSSFSGTSVISIGCMCFNVKFCDASGRSIRDDFCILAVPCGSQMVFLSLVVSRVKMLDLGTWLTLSVEAVIEVNI